MGLKTNLQY